jgi:hypothetical protein
MNQQEFLKRLSEVCEWEYYKDEKDEQEVNIRVKRVFTNTLYCNNCAKQHKQPRKVLLIWSKNQKRWIEKCAKCRMIKDNNTGLFSINPRGRKLMNY